MTNTPVLALVFAFGFAPVVAQAVQAPQHELTARADPFRSAELTFVANAGQWPEAVEFCVGSGPFTSWATGRGFVMQAMGSMPNGAGVHEACAVEFQFVGQSPGAAPRGELERPGRHHFLKAASSDGWVAGARGYGQIRFVSAWPGIDICLREASDGSRALEYDLYVHPTAELAQVAIQVSGAGALSIDDQGNLHIQTELGEMLHGVPKSWFQLADGTRQPAPVDFRLLDGNQFGFKTEASFPGATLVVDPGIYWSTYLGNLDMDLALAVTRAPNGDIIVVG